MAFKYRKMLTADILSIVTELYLHARPATGSKVRVRPRYGLIVRKAEERFASAQGQAVSLADLLDNLDMTSMGALEARKGKWGLLGDMVYLSVSAQDSVTEDVPVLGPITLPVRVDGDVSMKNWITTFAGTYRVVETERATLSLLGGARYFSLDLDVTLDLNSVITSR